MVNSFTKVFFFFCCCFFQGISQSAKIYISRPSTTYNSSLSDGSIMNPYTNFSQAIGATFLLLQNNISLTNISFSLLGNNFTIFQNSTNVGFFSNWEILLGRKLSIQINPDGCDTGAGCDREFLLILKTQNLSFCSVDNLVFSNFVIEGADSIVKYSQMNCDLCCDNKSFYLSNNTCYLGNFSILRTGIDPDRSLFELNSTGNLSFFNMKVRNLYSLDSNNYFSYVIRSKNSSSILIQNSQFLGLYMKQSIIKISYNSNVLISNATFQENNPFNYVENVTTQVFSYIISVDKLTSVNLTTVNSTFINSQFVVYSNSPQNYFYSCSFYVKIRTTTSSTLSGTTGYLYFGSSALTTLIQNCSFHQGNIQYNLTGVNKIALICTSDKTNFTLQDSIFLNLVLREARVFLATSFSQIVLRNNRFINIDHTCYDSPTSNCLYYLFDFSSSNAIQILNNTLINVSISTDKELFRFLSINSINFTNVTIMNPKLLNNPANYLVTFFSANNITLLHVMAKNYNIGFSGGFFSFDNKNLIFFNNSIFVANNTITTTGQIIYLSSTNTIFLDTVLFSSMCSLFRNSIYVLTSNYVLFNNCFLFNMTGSRGGASSIANNYNTYIVNNSLLQNLSTINQGSLVYIINSGNTVKIYFTKALDCYAQQDGSLAYVESTHTLVIQDTLIFNLYANMYGGVISTLNSNTFAITNTIVILAGSQSNGGVFNVLQNNKVTVFNSTFIYCSSKKSQAGILYSFQNNLIVFVNTTLQGNQAEQEGGCFFFDNNNLFNFSQSYIYDSSANGDAGFLMTKQNNVINIFGCLFNNSNSVLDAGLIKAQKFNNITLVSLVIKFITSLQNGGVFFLDTSNIFYLINSSISYSSAIKGGIFSISFNNVLVTKNSNLTNGTGNFQGGGFWANTNNIIIFNGCNFMNMTNAIGDGGLFYLSYNNSLTIFDCLIQELMTESTGGFIYAFEGNFINATSNNINDVSALFEGTFISLNILNFLTLSNIMFQTKYYYGQFYFLQKNSYIIQNVTLFVDQPSKNSFFGYFKEANNGTFLNCNFSWANTPSSYFIYFLNSFSQNIIVLNNTLIEFDSCEQLIFLNQNTTIYFHGFKLKNFTSSSPFVAFIEALGSKLFLHEFFLKNNMIGLIFYTENSSINLQNFTFIQDFQLSNFMVGYSSSILLKNGHFRRNSKQNETQALTLLNSEVNFTMIDIVGFSFYESGGFGFLQNSSIFIKNSRILLNKSWKKGGVFYLAYLNSSNQSKSYSVNVYKSTILNNKASENGSFLYSENYETINQQVNISSRRSYFLRNEAIRGGVFYSINSQKIHTTNCKVIGNRAKKYNPNVMAKGGVFYSLVNHSNPSMEIKIKNSSFQSNMAEIGAILYTEGLSRSSMYFSNNRFNNNRAKFYGDLWASETFEIRFFSQEKQLNDLPFQDQYFSSTVNSIKSGQNYSDCLMQLNGYDRFGSITIKTDEHLNTQLSLSQLEPSSIYSNSLNFTMSHGLICLASPIIRNELPMLSSFTYRILNNFPKTSFLKINLNFKSCDLGDRLNDVFQCTPCEANSYSFQTDFQSYSEMCKPCINQNFYCFGGGNYTPKPGFWRANSQSIYFYQCLNLDACEGDPRDFNDPSTEYLDIYSTGICSEGYRGVLCSDCDTDYGASSNFNCEHCQSEIYYLRVLGNLIMRILFALYLINIALNMCLSLMTEKPNNSRVIATNLLKILTNHMQILGIILKFPISIPSQIISASGVFLSVSPNVSEAFSVECILKKMGLVISLPYFKLISAGIYPFILVIFYWIFLEILRNMQCSGQYKGNKTHNISSILKAKTISYRDLTMTIFALVCLTCYADIANMSLAMFGCVQVNDGTKVMNLLYYDMTIDCDGKYHSTWMKQLSIPIILFFLALYPSSIILEIYKNLFKNEKEPDGRFFFRFGYFFYAYKRKFFFWDFVILLRKLVLIFINNFFFNQITSGSVNYPIIIVLLIISLAFIVQNFSKPFLSENFEFINNVEEASLMVSFLTVICLLIVIEAADVITSLTVFLFYAAILINLWFFYWWIKHYYTHYFKRKVVQFIKYICKLFGFKVFKSTAEKENNKDEVKKNSGKSFNNKTLNVRVKPSTHGASVWKKADSKIKAQPHISQQKLKITDLD